MATYYQETGDPGLRFALLAEPAETDAVIGGFSLDAAKLHRQLWHEEARRLYQLSNRP